MVASVFQVMHSVTYLIPSFSQNLKAPCPMLIVLNPFMTEAVAEQINGLVSI